MSRASLELLAVELENGAIELRSPEVGFFGSGQARDAMVGSGEFAGTLTALGRTLDLIIPAHVRGVIANDLPSEKQKPVGYGDLIYVVTAISGRGESTVRTAVKSSSLASGLVLRAPQSGRFYHRSAPSEPAFVHAGSVVVDGAPVGMIEVMKTFSHVVYRASGGLPASARVVRLIAKDGADVKTGEDLIEFEAAP